MLLTAGVSSLAPVVALLPGLPVYDSRLFGVSSATLIRVRAEEWAGEEALYWESSVFRYGRSNSTSGSRKSVVTPKASISFVIVLRGSRAVSRFVEVNSDEDADRAVNSLNGQNFGGRNLVVNEARPQAERAGGVVERWAAAGDMAVVAVAVAADAVATVVAADVAAIAETEAAIAVIVGKRALSR